MVVFTKTAMVFNARPSHVFRRVKDFAGQAYATGRDLAPGIKKGAEYTAASNSGHIDEYGGAMPLPSTGARAGPPTTTTLSSRLRGARTAS